MTQSLSRRLLGAGAVLLLSVVSVLAVRKLDKPAAEAAPEYRQKGDPQACVVVAEFSDFQCPACRMAESGVKKLLEIYGKDTRFIFKQFPLPARVHPWARQAALTAECAGRQGKFWPLHDALYEHQDDWVNAQDPAEALVALAKQAGAGEADLRACLKDPAASASVDADMKEGEERWVGSTPTFFINHKRFAGSQQFANLGTVWIDKILKQCKK